MCPPCRRWPRVFVLRREALWWPWARARLPNCRQCCWRSCCVDSEVRRSPHLASPTAVGEGQIVAALGSGVEAHYPLAKLTSFKVGGPADFFATARTEADIVRLVRGAWDLGLPVFIMGNGSNILLADKGIRGLVIRNLCANSKLETRNSTLL